MRKTIYSIATVLCLTAVSCQEWEPVFGSREEPQEQAAANMTANTTIAKLKSMYDGRPVHIEEEIVICGQVISSDATGNIYRSLYIQDATGGIEVKIGNTGLYNDYKPGQEIYVRCNGLTLGNYEGMLQLGIEDPTGDYESAYIDVKSLISAHVFKGLKGPEAAPQAVTESQLKEALKQGYKSDLFGRLVTLSDLTYGNEIFVLIYLDPNADKKASSNRLFLSDKTWGVTTWAMSANKMKEYLLSGVWDAAQIGNSKDYNYGTAGTAANKAKLISNASAYSVSQYFLMPGKTEVQVRSSGYSKFADTGIDPAILNGGAINLTGILTTYNGAAQFTLIDLGGVEIK